jgi:hypothetical protein
MVVVVEVQTAQVHLQITAKMVDQVEVLVTA